MASIIENTTESAANTVLTENEVVVDMVTKLEIDDTENVKPKGDSKKSDELTVDAKQKKKLDKLIGKFYF